MDYAGLAKEARRDILTLIFKAQTSHIASNFSVVDIAAVLHENLGKSDRVVWSKGWAAATIYYFLWRQGKITREQLESFPKSPFTGFADPSVPGVEVSGGAMGHGLPVAAGIALGSKRANEKSLVYCIMSDGEMNEGTTWEASALAAHHQLDNLIVFVDANKWQAMGKTADVLDMEPLEKKWESFGWKWMRVDGHNYQELESVWKSKDAGSEQKPRVIICDTIKGKGVSFFEDHLLYHYKYVEKEEYERAMAELQ